MSKTGCWFGIKAAIVTGRAFAFVEQRRRADLLAEAGELQFRQALDGFKEIIHARLQISVQAEVLPELVHFHIGVGLRILAVLAFEEIAQDERVALVTDQRLHVEVRDRRRVVGKIDPLPVFRDGQAAGVGFRVQVVQVIILEHTLAPRAKLVVQVRPESDPAALAIIQMRHAVELVIQEPGVRPSRNGPKRLW